MQSKKQRKVTTAQLKTIKQIYNRQNLFKLSDSVFFLQTVTTVYQYALQLLYLSYIYLYNTSLILYSS